MTNNPTIDGVSREDQRHASVKALHDIMQSVPSASLYSLAEAVLDAGYSPAVERQKVLTMKPQYVSVSGLWIECAADDMQAVTFYKKTPEVAALQSTIAQLQARIAELESGRGEPVAEVQHGPFDDVGAPQWVRVVTLGDFDLEHIPDGTKLFNAPPAPVAVVLTDDQILEAMRPSIYAADGGYVFDTEKPYVVSAGRALIACLDATAALNKSP